MAFIDDKFNQMLVDHLNRKWEVVDPTNPNQCFDLVVGWSDLLGLPRSFQHLFAYQIFTNPTELTRQHYELIPNTPLGVPKRGDIMVWSQNYGPAGHTAVINTASLLSFEAFSQNDPVGSVCILKRYNYNSTLGWLRPKLATKYTVKQLVPMLQEAVNERRWE